MAVRVEILTIGDELVEGRLVDSNAAVIADHLGLAGLAVARHTTVGDEDGEIVAALREAAGRAEAVLVTGGLGPTSDDRTAAGVATAFARPLERSAQALAHVRGLFASRGVEMTPNNEKQADLPAGAWVLPNPQGTAVGFAVEVEGCRVYVMPGVPSEMEPMLRAVVLPDLTAAVAGEAPLVATLKLFGVGESKVGQLLEDLEERAAPVGRLVVQYRATFPEIHVRLVLHRPGGEAGAALLAELADEAQRRLDRWVFARGGQVLQTTFAEAVLQRCAARGATVASAEGSGGGALARLLAGAADGGAVHAGSVVAGRGGAGLALLGLALPPGGETGASELAAAARERLGADWGLAALPGLDAAEGSWAALAGPSGATVREVRFRLEGERRAVLAAYAALHLLRRVI